MRGVIIVMNFPTIRKLQIVLLMVVIATIIFTSPDVDHFASFVILFIESVSLVIVVGLGILFALLYVLRKHKTNYFIVFSNSFFAAGILGSIFNILYTGDIGIALIPLFYANTISLIFYAIQYKRREQGDGLC